MKGFARMAAMFALAVSAASCGDDDGSTAPEGPTVTANASDQFVPGTLDIDVGETVTWVFGPVSHDVVFSQIAGAPNNIAISVNTNVSRTFATAGVFPYECTLHSGMTGTIRVGQ
jgi:plastocyanin